LPICDFFLPKYPHKKYYPIKEIFECIKMKKFKPVGMILHTGGNEGYSDDIE